MPKITRRSFVKTSAAGALAFAAPAIVTAQKAERPFTVALIGCGWWGKNILTEAIKSNAARVVGVCDVDKEQLQTAADLVTKMTTDVFHKYDDYRELLKKEKPQICIVATPDHWHPLITIAAVESGAHVYVEKPVGHTVLEGRAMTRAARDSGRRVQVGTHRRVSPHNISAMQFLRSGKVGSINMVRSFVHTNWERGEKKPNEEPPKHLNWDMWLGPAPERPFNPDLHPRGFRQYLDYANGQIGDWGIHWFDQILWWTEEKYPKRIFSSGDRFWRTDGSDAPDTQIATFEFESFTATWEHRLYGANPAERHDIGCYFYGDKGTFHLGWLDGWTFYPADPKQPQEHADAKLNEPDLQNIKELWADFLVSIEGFNLPTCDIEIGHRSTAMSLLANLSAKVGRAIEWDGEKEQIVGDDEANKLLKREYRAPWKYPV